MVSYKLPQWIALTTNNLARRSRVWWHSEERFSTSYNASMHMRQSYWRNRKIYRHKRPRDNSYCFRFNRWVSWTYSVLVFELSLQMSVQFVIRRISDKQTQKFDFYWFSIKFFQYKPERSVQAVFCATRQWHLEGFWKITNFAWHFSLIPKSNWMWFHHHVVSLFTYMRNVKFPLKIFVVHNL